jgi:hypothetical protein
MNEWMITQHTYHRKFGQIVVWFEWEVIEWTETWIGSRNWIGNVSSSQTQYCSLWSCSTKHFTDRKWQTQNLCILIDSVCVSLFFFTSNLSYLFSELFLLFFSSLQHILSHVYTHSLFVVWIVLNTHTHIGFWNVTNSWENRWRKGNNTTQHNITQHNTFHTSSQHNLVSIETEINEMSRVVW